MEDQPVPIDLKAIPQLQDQSRLGFDYYQSFTDWDFHNNTTMHQPMMLTVPQSQSFEPNANVLAATKHSNENPILSNSILDKAFPRQSEKVQRHSPCHSPSELGILTFNLSDEPRTVPRKKPFASVR